MGAFGTGFGIFRDAEGGSGTVTGTGTPNFLAKFITATSIGDGSWENVGNHIYPTTTGSNLGQDANRIGTIFMSSVIDYSTAGLTISSSATGAQVVHVETAAGVNAKSLHIAPTGYTPLGNDFL